MEASNVPGTCTCVDALTEQWAVAGGLPGVCGGVAGRKEVWVADLPGGGRCSASQGCGWGGH